MEIKEMTTRIMYPADGMAVLCRESKTISRDWVALAIHDSPDRYEEIPLEEADRLQAEWDAEAEREATANE